MIRFASPLWLAGLAALAIPIVLHLWSTRPARVVRIGSLRGLEGPPGARALGHRLEQLPLLLLRMAILSSAVLGMAGLSMRRHVSAAPPVELVLVDPAALADSLAVFQEPLVDSLRRSGSTLHLLAPGFPDLESVAALDGPSPTAWSLIAGLADTLPPGSRIRVIGAPTVGAIGSTRPRVTATASFHPVGQQRNWTFETDLERGSGVRNRLADRPVTASIMQVFHDQELASAARIAAAAWAAAMEASSGVEPLVDMSAAEGKLSSEVEHQVILWLSGQSVSRNVLAAVERGANLIEFVAGADSAPSATSVGPVASHAIPVTLLRQPLHSSAGQLPGAPLLSDDAGRPILTTTRSGLGTHYRFAAGPAQDWTRLAAGSDLPEIALLTLRGTGTGVRRAPVASSQARLEPTDAPVAADTAWAPLTRVAFGLAAILLLLERLVVHLRRQPAAGLA